MCKQCLWQTQSVVTPSCAQVTIDMHFSSSETIANYLSARCGRVRSILPKLPLVPAHQLSGLAKHPPFHQLQECVDKYRVEDSPEFRLYIAHS